VFTLFMFMMASRSSSFLGALVGLGALVAGVGVGVGASSVEPPQPIFDFG